MPKYSLRPYQLTVNTKLSGIPRHADLSDPGTGKTLSAVERLREHVYSGLIRCVILVAPSSVVPGWREAFEAQWDGAVAFHDCRSGKKDAALLEAIVARPTLINMGVPPRLHVYATTADKLRGLMTSEERLKNKPTLEWGRIKAMKGRGVALILDEAHLYLRPESTRARVARSLSWYVDGLILLTGTLIGRDTHGRAWGFVNMLAPQLLRKHGVEEWYQFKVKYCVCTDLQGNVVPGGHMVKSVDDEAVERDLLGPLRGRIARVTEQEALPDLPEMTVILRRGTMSAETKRMMTQLRKERRVTVKDEPLCVCPNPGVTRMRVLELASGWLEGRPVHTDKLNLLAEVLSELDGFGLSLWAIKTRTLLSSALVAAGVDPVDAMRMVGEIPRLEEGAVDTGTPEYRAVLKLARDGRVGVLRGGMTPAAQDRVLREWRDGTLYRVAIHPAVGGPGLNLQHCNRAVYVEPCGSVIERSQSLKRHHRSGQKSAVWVYDLAMEGGPEEVVMKAHREQREAEEELMTWLGR